MKNRIQLILLLLSAVWFSGCEDKELITLNEQVQPNVLNPLSAASFVLEKVDAATVFQKFTWSPADYGFDASVNYTLQMDVATGDFSEPFSFAPTRAVELEIKVSDMNDGLLALGLTPQEAADVKFRVLGELNENTPEVISNSVTSQITPYATAFPPIYGMGAALRGWGPWPDNAIEFQSEEFNKFSTITVLTNGEAFRFFKQLDWNPTSYNYPFFTSVSSVFENANDGDSNFKVVGATGYYLINIDLTAKTVTAEATTEPVLYMMGAGVNGWGPWNDKEVKMTYLKPGVFQATTSFSNGAFRFFGQADWGPTSYNYPYFETVDLKFANANDGDSNLEFVGTPGLYTITVDLNKKTVIEGDPNPPLFMMGAALNGWGPWNDKEVKLTYISPGSYKATATFTNGEAFRFFAQADWGPDSYNYPYFTTVASVFENAGDGDSNLRYVGTTGTVTIKVNLTTKIVSVE